MVAAAGRRGHPLDQADRRLPSAAFDGGYRHISGVVPWLIRPPKCQQLVIGAKGRRGDRGLEISTHPLRVAFRRPPRLSSTARRGRLDPPTAVGRVWVTVSSEFRFGIAMLTAAEITGHVAHRCKLNSIGEARVRYHGKRSGAQPLVCCRTAGCSRTNRAG